jgi:hypothetical protein
MAQLRETLTGEHARELRAMRQQAEQRVAAATERVDTAAREAAACTAAQEVAMESSESECRRLYVALKQAEAQVDEQRAAAYEGERRATQLQALLDAASAGRSTRAKQSSAEKLQLRSLAGQVRDVMPPAPPRVPWPCLSLSLAAISPAFPFCRLH